jgi:hypothetical protein
MTPIHAQAARPRWDVFISYAHEDKETIARPLAHLLDSRFNLKVWFDEFELKIGDSVSEAINRGLRESRYGVVIISRAFMQKKWPQNELNALFALESNTQRRILPVWHDVQQEEVGAFNAVLLDRLAVEARTGVDEVASTIADKVGRPRVAFFKDEAPDGVVGLWIGLSGRLRLEEYEGEIVGYYDWFGKRWAGGIHGQYEDEVLRFQWDWNVNDADGSGFFVRTTLSTRLWPQYHLIGGWAYGHDNDVLETAINRYKAFLASRNPCYDDVPHRMIPSAGDSAQLTPWAFSFGSYGIHRHD